MSPPCHLTNGVVRLMDIPILQSCSISPTFCSVASLPIESTPLSFLGWHVNGVGPIPPPATTTIVRRHGPPVGRRARGTWTATSDYVQKTLHLWSNAPRDSGRPERVRPRQGARLVGPALCRLPCNPRRSRPRPHQRDLFAPRSASMKQFYQPRAPHLTASLREKPAQTSVPPQPLFGCFRPDWMWCFRPAWNYAPGHAYWNQDPE